MRKRSLLALALGLTLALGGAPSAAGADGKDRRAQVRRAAAAGGARARAAAGNARARAAARSRVGRSHPTRPPSSGSRVRPAGSGSPYRGGTPRPVLLRPADPTDGSSASRRATEPVRIRPAGGPARMAPRRIPAGGTAARPVAMTGSDWRPAPSDPGVVRGVAAPAPRASDPGFDGNLGPGGRGEPPEPPPWDPSFGGLPPPDGPAYPCWGCGYGWYPAYWGYPWDPFYPYYGWGVGFVVGDTEAGSAASPGAPERLAPESATLQLVIKPKRAQVWLDGVEVGTSAGYRRKDRLLLDPGDHVLELRLDGFQTLRLRFTAEPGGRYVIEEKLNRGEGEDPRSAPAGDAEIAGRRGGTLPEA